MQFVAKKFQFVGKTKIHLANVHLYGLIIASTQCVLFAKAGLGVCLVIQICLFRLIF